MEKKVEIQAPLAVANLIIEVANKENNPVTNLKLQKVLFFLQGYYLSTFKQRLINGEFAKWQYGPVEEDVYREFKSLGSYPLTSPSIKLTEIDGKISVLKEQVPDVIKDELEEKIKKIIDQKAWYLVELTHAHKSWNDYKDKIFNHNAEDYTDDEIESCFKDNAKELGINFGR